MKKYGNIYFFGGTIFLFLAVLWFTRMNDPVCGALYALCAVIGFINAYRRGKAEDKKRKGSEEA